MGAKEEERVTPGVLAVAGGGGPAKKGLTPSPTFFSCGCHNKVPQIGWLKPTKTESLTVLEAGHLKWSVRWPHSLQRLWGRTYLLLASSSFGWLPAFLGFWSHHSDRCLHRHITFSSSVSTLHFPLVRIHMMEFRAHLGNPG